MLCKERRLDSASFTSKVDKKGRVLVSAELRKKLGLRFGTRVCAEVDGKRFLTRVDERGRFSVPAGIRNGRDGVRVNIRVCGACEAGSSPAPGPISRRGAS